MRLVLSLGLLLALLATGIPYFMGQQVEQRWHALDAETTPAVQLQDSQHQRGWWSPAKPETWHLAVVGTADRDPFNPGCDSGDPFGAVAGRSGHFAHAHHPAC